MKATGDQATVLAQFADGPAQLENAILGVADSDFGAAPSRGGWSIREIVHHLADGDDIWKSCIKMALGNEQAEFHLDWYWAIPQTDWGRSWTYAHRSVRSSLELLKANRTHILDLLAQRADAWERSVEIREPNGQVTRVSVGFVVEMQANHVFHHIKQILAIRQDHRLTPAGADGANRDGVQVVQPRKKALRPLATRTPPAPSESHADIEEWIRGVMPNLCPIVTHLDALIRDTIPGLQYAVKWKKAYYGLPGRGWIIEVAAYDVSANVVFFGGAEFNSPPPLGEGSRYVKVRTLEEAQGAELLAWIQQSGRVAGWK